MHGYPFYILLSVYLFKTFIPSAYLEVLLDQEDQAIQAHPGFQVSFVLVLEILSHLWDATVIFSL